MSHIIVRCNLIVNLFRLPTSLLRRFDVNYRKIQPINIPTAPHYRSLGSSTSTSTNSKNQKVLPPTSLPSPVLPLWLVKHPSTVAIVPVVGNVAYSSLASGFLCTDVLSLRVLLICGYSGLVTYHALRPQPLMLPLRWSAFFVMVNVSMATMLILNRMEPTLTEEEEELHIINFAPLTRKQFKALIDIGVRTTYPRGTFLTRTDEPCRKLYFILSGTTKMTDSSGKCTSRLQKGGFPNCMSFQRTGWNSSKRNTNCTAYGTIQCEGQVECIVWDDRELLALLDSSPNDDMRLRMDHVVIEAVIRRLLHDIGGADVKDYIRVISQGWADKAVQQLKIQSMTKVNRPAT